MAEKEAPVLYEKEALTFEEQADRLLERGLTAGKADLIRRLEAVSYYRLSGYLYPFRQPKTEAFKNGTNLETVWDRYCFDRRLRVLVLDAIERIEVSLRTKVVYHFAHAHGPFGYLHESKLPKLSVTEYLEWRTGLLEETQRSKESFKKHFLKKYTAHQNLPLWMAAELMTMGSLLTFFRGVEPEIKRKVAGEYGFPDELMVSWLRSLNGARNICAHHSRFWNRILGYEALLPNKNKFPHWHGEYKLTQNRSGIIIMICRHMLQLISPTSQWHTRMEVLFDEYPEIPVTEMGLPENWKQHPVWAKTKDLNA